MGQSRRTNAPFLEARFAPSWELIEPLRGYVDVFAKLNVPTCSDKAGIVLQELLENAIKYGAPSAEVELNIDLVRSESGQGLEVRVSNKANSSRVAILQKEFEKIASLSGPEVFARALERLRKAPQGASMLGLARVASTSKLTLELQDDRVILIAHVV